MEGERKKGQRRKGCDVYEKYCEGRERILMVRNTWIVLEKRSNDIIFEEKISFDDRGKLFKD